MVFYSFTLLFLLTSCGQDLTNGALRIGTSASGAAASDCNCPTTVDPVCVSFNGTSLTYKNGCLAQCDGRQYISGACTANNCNSNSGAVCGTRNSNQNPPVYQIYSDECALLKAGSDQVTNDKCNL